MESDILDTNYGNCLLFVLGTSETRGAGGGGDVPADLDPPQNGPPGPNPLANMDRGVYIRASEYGPMGVLNSLADLDSPREFGPLAYFIIVSYCILYIVSNRHK